MKKEVRIFEIHHKRLSEPEYVYAENMKEAINRFVEHYMNDDSYFGYYEVREDGITNIVEFFNKDCIY